MQIKIYSKSDNITSTWSGGKTTQLWILPIGGNYATRNFEARISSATVTLNESDFTSLPGVVRYITPLSGGFTLSHPNGKSVTLTPLSEPYRFDGGTITHCVGTATDFNLMLKGVDGGMEILRGETTLRTKICCLYPIDCDAVTVNGTFINVTQGDLIELRPEKDEPLTLSAPLAILCKIDA